MNMPVAPPEAPFHTVATVAAGGDTRAHGARGSLLELRDSALDYSTAPAHLCFWVPLDGGIDVLPRRGRAYRVSDARLTIIPPGSVWRGSWRGRLKSMMLEVHPAVLEELAQGPIIYPQGGELLIAEDETLRHGILSLQHSLAAPAPDDGLFTGHMARAIAAHYLRRYCSSRIATGAGDRLTPLQLRRAFELIEARLAERLTLEELAETAGLSVAGFCRRFKKSVGLPPYQYVLRTRIERAKAELAQRGRSASEIALSLGFYDQAQFSNAFRRIVGISPREYRHRLQGG